MIFSLWRVAKFRLCMNTSLPDSSALMIEGSFTDLAFEIKPDLSPTFCSQVYLCLFTHHLLTFQGSMLNFFAGWCMLSCKSRASPQHFSTLILISDSVSSTLSSSVCSVPGCCMLVTGDVFTANLNNKFALWHKPLLFGCLPNTGSEPTTIQSHWWTCYK